MSKALLIKSYTTLTTGTQGNWNDLNMASSYIQGIQTGKILEDVTADKIAALISGVPTMTNPLNPLLRQVTLSH